MPLVRKIEPGLWEVHSHISTGDDFLTEEGLLEEAEAIAVKRVPAFQIIELMEA
jgi:hypothetical protein